jgi:uncharacterized membrane protein YgdD (TMEM256/DUF423 family)
MNQKPLLIIASLFGLTGVALGAFGAHGLRGIVPPDLLATFETGVRYQMYHTFALFVTALLYGSADGRRVRIAGICFIVGIVIFSGSLYAMTFTGIRMFGAVTPFGGLGFLAGWVFLLLAALKIKKEN